ncbi:sugar porter family MFS transporter [Carnimonas bestiolae]|uniref:sugar porter family MFS transporter n=1 Tax=Carnimonas bestiolae TaxID=3402172 RepID=UPI003F4AF6FB
MTATSHQHSLPIPWRCLIPVSSIGVIYGYDMGASASVAESLPNDLGLSQSQFSSLNAIIGIGLLLGAVSGGVITNRLGRQRSLLLVAVMFTLFALGEALATGLTMLNICRLMLGIGIGLSTVAAPVFVSEISPSERRGGLIAMYQVSNACGIILAYVAGFLLAPLDNWRLNLGIAAIPSLLVALAVLRLPDTPVWYLMREARDKAVATLRGLGHSPADAEALCADTARRLDEEHAQRAGIRHSLLSLLRPPYRRAFIFVVGFGALAKLTGINALVYYQPLIFAGMGFSGSAGKLLLPGLITLFSVATTLIALVLVDRIGRKPLMQTGLTLMLLGDVVIATVFALGTASTALSVAGVLGFVLFQAGFGMSFGSLIWIYSAETLPGRLRAVGATIALSSDFLINIVIAQFFLAVFSAVGGSVTFMGFAAMALAAIVFCRTLAPETKGRPLDDIRLFWENGGRWESSSDSEVGASIRR